MKRKRMITAMGLNQQWKKSERCTNANATAQKTRRLESTVVTLASKRTVMKQREGEGEGKGEREKKEKEKGRIISVFDELPPDELEYSRQRGGKRRGQANVRGKGKAKGKAIQSKTTPTIGSDAVLSELLSRELELLGVTEGSIAFDSSESDTSETGGRSRSNTDGNEYDEEVVDEEEEEEEEEEDVELDRILSEKIFSTSTRSIRQTPEKSRSVFEYDTSNTCNSAKMRENSSVEATFIVAEMKERQRREAVT
ncbi:uncharacterized protein MONOS_12049 [Monocercomonoides exilis]|uniref:uncharacterized protein n=1 Tax=Monocercomonoides exilis TaxID=2049356 RepID=UPI00355A1DF3|nr:hypothetical protein MONOS_12049 [Monocercomonoides exilis]|eukprot:MONOS_12049.1-p1 / transcript=MONOS_12049.1 / gene=MONOS_12049 / organism=Monocercomonoides_exilis_PA203 / gene_product=unspecified product / transcript_product=unspecified product / location=Mono_scaffold00639:32820-33581(-) / protein_length=254 / sequence_SO=supercontig / SO=protein_coding / is_pseudo=false